MPTAGGAAWRARIAATACSILAKVPCMAIPGAGAGGGDAGTAAARPRGCPGNLVRDGRRRAETPARWGSEIFVVVELVFVLFVVVELVFVLFVEVLVLLELLLVEFFVFEF